MVTLKVVQLYLYSYPYELMGLRVAAAVSPVGATQLPLLLECPCVSLLLGVLIWVFLVAMLERGGCIARYGHQRCGLDGVTAAVQLTGEWGLAGAQGPPLETVWCKLGSPRCPGTA